MGGRRRVLKSTEAEDDTFYLLTLAAVAKELRRRGLCEAKGFVAVGLPLTRFGSEKSDFVKYLTAEKDIEFLFENIKYHVVIENVAVPLILADLHWIIFFLGMVHRSWLYVILWKRV